MAFERKLAAASGVFETFNVLEFNDVDQAQALDQTSYTQVHVITCNELTQAQNTSNIFIDEGAPPDNDIFNIGELLQAQPLETATVIQNHVFVIDELTQAQITDGIIYEAIFVTDEISQAQVLDGVIAGTIFNIDDLNQSQILDSAVSGVVHPISVDELLHSQTIEQTEILMSIRRIISSISNIEVQQLIINLPPGTVDGDYLLALLGTDGAGETHTAPGAWTAVEINLNSGGHTFSVWERIVSGAEPTSYTFTWTNNEKAVGAILLIRGNNNAGIISSKGTITGDSELPIGTSLTSVVSKSLYLGINSHDQTGGSFYDIIFPTGLTNKLNLGAGPQSGVAIQVSSLNVIDIAVVPIQNWIMSKKDNWYTVNLMLTPFLESFDIDSLSQLQSLDGAVVISAIFVDALLQSQSLEATDVIASNDNHQFFINDSSQAQIIDGTTIVNAVGSFLVIHDEKSSGTAGGTSVAGANIRVLNTVKHNSITGASLSSNQFTLPVGTYEIVAKAIGVDGQRQRLYLFNTSDTSEDLTGTSDYTDLAGTTSGGWAWLQGRFTIAATKVFELRHRIQVAQVGDGLGAAVNDGTNNEVYSQVIIRKTS